MTYLIDILRENKFWFKTDEEYGISQGIYTRLDLIDNSFIWVDSNNDKVVYYEKLEELYRKHNK